MGVLVGDRLRSVRRRSAIYRVAVVFVPPQYFAENLEFGFGELADAVDMAFRHKHQVFIDKVTIPNSVGKDVLSDPKRPLIL